MGKIILFATFWLTAFVLTAQNTNNFNQFINGFSPGDIKYFDENHESIMQNQKSQLKSSDEDIWQNDSVIFYKIDNEELTITSKEEFERDKNGNILKSTFYNYKSGAYTLYSIDTILYKYYDSGILKEKLSKYWDAFNKEWTDTAGLITFNKEGQILTNLTIENNTGRKTKYEYTYDDNNNLVFKKFSRTNYGTDTWSDVNYENHFYDGSKRTYTIFKKWDKETLYWLFTDSVVYNYDSLKNISSIDYYRNAMNFDGTKSDVIKLSHTDNYIYDSVNNIISLSYIQHAIDYSFTYFKRTYDYDENNQLTSELYQADYYFTGSLEDKSKTIYYWSIQSENGDVTEPDPTDGKEGGNTNPNSTSGISKDYNNALNFCFNPSDKTLKISNIDKNNTPNTLIYSLSGTLIGKFSHCNRINLSHLSTGVYIVKVKSEDMIFTDKIIIE